jgi:hypothetical protein
MYNSTAVYVTRGLLFAENNFRVQRETTSHVVKLQALMRGALMRGALAGQQRKDFDSKRQDILKVKELLRGRGFVTPVDVVLRFVKNLVRITSVKIQVSIELLRTQQRTCK